MKRYEKKETEKILVSRAAVQFAADCFNFRRFRFYFEKFDKKAKFT